MFISPVCFPFFVLYNHLLEINDLYLEATTLQTAQANWEELHKKIIERYRQREAEQRRQAEEKALEKKLEADLEKQIEKKLDKALEKALDDLLKGFGK